MTSEGQNGSQQRTNGLGRQHCKPLHRTAKIKPGRFLNKICHQRQPLQRCKKWYTPVKKDVRTLKINSYKRSLGVFFRTMSEHNCNRTLEKQTNQKKIRQTLGRQIPKRGQTASTAIVGHVASLPGVWCGTTEPHVLSLPPASREAVYWWGGGEGRNLRVSYRTGVLLFMCSFILSCSYLLGSCQGLDGRGMIGDEIIINVNCLLRKKSRYMKYSR